jgi:hypothetical protein
MSTQIGELVIVGGFFAAVVFIMFLGWRKGKQNQNDEQDKSKK